MVNPCLKHKFKLPKIHEKMAMSVSQRYPLNLYLTNNVEDIVIFTGLKVFYFDNFL